MGESGNGDSGAEDTPDSYGANMGLSDAEVSAATSGGDSPSDSGTSFGVNLGYDAKGNSLGNISATGSTAKDQEIGFSDGKGGPGENFSAFGGITDSEGNPVGKEAQSPSEFSAAMDTIGIDQALNEAIASSPTAGVNQGITPAGVSPTFSGVGVSDVFDPTVDVDRSGKTAPTAIEQAAMDVPGLDAFGPVAPGFSPVGISPSVTVEALPSITQGKGIQAALSNLDKARDKAAGMGSPKGIDFGVTAPVGITAGVSPAPPGFEEQVGRDIDQVALSVDMFGAPGTSGASFDADLADEVVGSVNPDDFTGLMSSRDPAGITAGVSPAPPGFEEKVGKDFDPGRMAQIEGIYGKFDPVSGSYPTTLPGPFGVVEDKTKDALATSIALGRNVTPMEAIFGYTAPDMTKDKETIEEFNQRTKNTFSPDQIVTDAQGVVIGLKDKSGNLVTGRDPNAPEIDESSEPQAKKRAPKKPDDPCPEGYKLIDGKCTIIEDPNEGTGFIRFPTDRDPPFQKGPFEPKFKPTPIAGIRGLNPITFNNPFRR